MLTVDGQEIPGWERETGKLQNACLQARRSPYIRPIGEFIDIYWQCAPIGRHHLTFAFSRRALTRYNHKGDQFRYGNIG